MKFHGMRFGKDELEFTFTFSTRDLDLLCDGAEHFSKALAVESLRGNSDRKPDYDRLNEIREFILKSIANS